MAQIDWNKTEQKIHIPGAGDSDDVWIETFSGGKFHILNPQPEEVLIVDIAHALAFQCRFTGHVRKFYSVAEHCISASLLVPPHQALEALLHDSSEAYLSDLSRPAKSLTQIGPPYLELEARITYAIAVRFGVDHRMSPEVKKADNYLLGVEGRLLMHNIDGWTNELPKIFPVDPVELNCYSPTEAENVFLARFRELYEERRPFPIYGDRG